LRAMKPNHARELLARERQRIEEALTRLQPEPDQELTHLDQHPADEGTEVFEAERDEGLADQLQEERDRARRAAPRGGDLWDLRGER
jgi:RNA polymerase-binding transcription factor